MGNGGDVSIASDALCCADGRPSPSYYCLATQGKKRGINEALRSYFEDYLNQMTINNMHGCGIAPAYPVVQNINTTFKKGTCLLLDQQGKRFCTLIWSVDQQ